MTHATWYLEASDKDFNTLAEALKAAGEFDEIDQIEIDHENRVIYCTFFRLPDDY